MDKSQTERLLATSGGRSYVYALCRPERDPVLCGMRGDGRPLPNLFAAGGAACGVSGPSAAGYLSGNGLLTAITLGRLSGAAAARLAASRPHGSA